MKFIKIQTIAYVLTILLVCTACKNEPEDAVANAKEIVEGSTYDHPDFSEKYNAYISFQNSGNKTINKAYDQYYRYYDPAKPLTEGNFPTIYSYNNHTTKKLKTSSEMEPKLEYIDASALALYKEAKTLDSLMQLHSFYCSKQEYKRDNYKQAIALDSLITPQFQTYFTVYSEFVGQINVLADELTARDLKELKEQGLMTRYNLLAGVVKADKLMAYINSDYDNEFKNLTRDEVNKIIEEFNVPLTEVEKRSLDDEKLKEELGTFKASSVSSYIREAGSLIREVNSFMDRVEKNDWDFPRTHPTIPHTGSYEKISQEYNDLISQYNAIL